VFTRKIAKCVAFVALRTAPDKRINENQIVSRGGAEDAKGNPASERAVASSALELSFLGALRATARDIRF
jgi:hypothetical protein